MWLLVLRYHIRPRQLEALPFRAGDPKMPVMCPNSRKASRVLDSCAGGGAAGAPVGQQALRSGLLFLPSGPGEDLRLHEVQPLHPRSCVYKDRSVGQQIGPCTAMILEQDVLRAWRTDGAICTPRTSCLSSFFFSLPSLHSPNLFWPSYCAPNPLSSWAL